MNDLYIVGEWIQVTAIFRFLVLLWACWEHLAHMHFNLIDFILVILCLVSTYSTLLKCLYQLLLLWIIRIEPFNIWRNMHLIRMIISFSYKGLIAFVGKVNRRFTLQELCIRWVILWGRTYWIHPFILNCRLLAEVLRKAWVLPLIIQWIMINRMCVVCILMIVTHTCAHHVNIVLASSKRSCRKKANSCRRIPYEHWQLLGTILGVAHESHSLTTAVIPIIWTFTCSHTCKVLLRCKADLSESSLKGTLCLLRSIWIHIIHSFVHSRWSV